MLHVVWFILHMLTVHYRAFYMATHQNALTFNIDLS